MLTPEKVSELLDSTMTVLEIDPAKVVPQNGTSVINEWLVPLRQAENATDVVNLLEQLKNQLESNINDPDSINQLLTKLATQTSEFSTMMGAEGDVSTRLEALAAALQSLAGQAGQKI